MIEEIIKEPVWKKLPVQLTTEEINTAGKRLGQVVRELEDLESEKKEVNSDIKARADSRTAEARRLSNLITNGREYRPIECYEYLDHALGIAILRRSDTFEEVDRRQLEDEERQLKMNLDAESEAREAAREQVARATDDLDSSNCPICDAPDYGSCQCDAAAVQIALAAIRGENPGAAAIDAVAAESESESVSAAA